MITIYFKSCSKCHGDVEASTDEYHNKTLKCLQCSFEELLGALKAELKA